MPNKVTLEEDSIQTARPNPFLTFDCYPD